MKTIKVSEATGTTLDWLVAKCEGFGSCQYMKMIDLRYNVSGKVSCLLVPIERNYTHWSPSTNWAQGGPIIERHKINIHLLDDKPGTWAASLGNPWKTMPNVFSRLGPAPLIAAMRCYAASKLGDTTEIPDGLL